VTTLPIKSYLFIQIFEVSDIFIFKNLSKIESGFVFGREGLYDERETMTAGKVGR
jgi:hypothetical protein